MRTTRALVVSAATVAAVGLAAPVAAAWDQPTRVTAAPSVIAPGGQLVLTVDGSACAMKGSTIKSNAFPATRLISVDGRSATATVTVNSNATGGSYSVITNCDNKLKTFASVFTVIGGVMGGLGGSSSSGATPADMAIGGGLVAAALVGGGVFWMRRRSESRI